MRYTYETQIRQERVIKSTRLSDYGDKTLRDGELRKKNEIKRKGFNKTESSTNEQRRKKNRKEVVTRGIVVAMCKVQTQRNYSHSRVMNGFVTCTGGEIFSSRGN